MYNAKGFDSAHARHDDVGQQKMDGCGMSLRYLNGFRTACRLKDVMSMCREVLADRNADWVIVIDKKNRNRRPSLAAQWLMRHRGGTVLLRLLICARQINFERRALSSAAF